MMESHLCPKCESGAYFSNSIPSGSLNIEGLNLNLLLMIIAIDSNSQIMQMGALARSLPSSAPASQPLTPCLSGRPSH